VLKYSEGEDILGDGAASGDESFGGGVGDSEVLEVGGKGGGGGDGGGESVASGDSRRDGAGGHDSHLESVGVRAAHGEVVVARDGRGEGVGVRDGREDIVGVGDESTVAGSQAFKTDQQQGVCQGADRTTPAIAAVGKVTQNISWSSQTSGSGMER